MACVGGAQGQAFEWIDRSGELKKTFVIQVEAWHPHLDVLRQDPRYEELLRRINFPVEDSR